MGTDDMKKALVLAGGHPQITLIEKLKSRNIFTILADYYENPVARKYADKFYQISTLDVPAIKKLAIEENVDFLITVCTDQALLTVAFVSEQLGLPCYIDYQTALNVTNKSYMKKVFYDNSIPTAKYQIYEDFESVKSVDWKYPVIVKPVDCNSSKGVKKVNNIFELELAFNDAIHFSRTKTAIVEDYISGDELSVDVFVENGVAYVLDITNSEKIKEDDKFVIFRTWHPASVSEQIVESIKSIAQKIADSFGIFNSPMLIQLISDGSEVYVLEFSARTGGGVKFLSIKRETGFDVIDAVIDLTLGKKVHYVYEKPSFKYMLDEYIYCNNGQFDHLEGFERLKQDGIMADYYLFKWQGAIFDGIENSGDRLAGFSIISDSIEELSRKHNEINSNIKAISTDNKDLIRHDLLTPVGM